MKTIYAQIVACTFLSCLLIGCSRSERPNDVADAGSVDYKAIADRLIAGFVQMGESKDDLIKRLGTPASESTATNNIVLLDYVFPDGFKPAEDAGVRGFSVVIETQKVVGWLVTYSGGGVQLKSQPAVAYSGTARTSGNTNSMVFTLHITSASLRSGFVRITDEDISDLGYFSATPSFRFAADEINLQRTGFPPTVTLRLLGASDADFYEFTKQSVGETVVIMYGTQIVAAPVMRTPIEKGGIQISLGEAFRRTLPTAPRASQQ